MIFLRTYTPGVPVTPGFYDMNAADYHADPCPSPSLSSSVAKVLVNKSPKHAWKIHPRLGGEPQDAPSREMQIGSAVHALALGKGAELFVVTAPDYKTATAREQRDRALAVGRIPILEPDLAMAQSMAKPIEEELKRLFSAHDGWMAEIVGVWEVDGVWRRMMLDAVSPDGALIVDLKTTVSAAPGAFATQFVRMGYDISEAFYLDGLRALLGDVDGQRMVFIAQERGHPEAITLHESDQATREIAMRDVLHAHELWTECLAADHWPSYDKGPHLIASPGWRMPDLEITE